VRVVKEFIENIAAIQLDW